MYDHHKQQFDQQVAIEMAATWFRLGFHRLGNLPDHLVLRKISDVLLEQEPLQSCGVLHTNTHRPRHTHTHTEGKNSIFITNQNIPHTHTRK